MTGFKPGDNASRATWECRAATQGGPSIALHRWSAVEDEARPRGDREGAAGQDRREGRDGGRGAGRGHQGRAADLEHGPDRSQFEFPPDRMLAKGSKRRTIREALGYEEILSRVRAEFAGCKSSVKCLRYYATKMRGRDVRVPTRPRKPVAVR